MTVPSLVVLFFLAPISSLSPVQRGDIQFALIQYPLAEAIYDSALVGALDSSEVLWRMARLYVCQGDVSSPDEKLALYQMAEGFARRCIAIDSTKAEGHTWRAAALGNIAMFEGAKTRVRLCTSIKEELDLSIRLNPADDIPYSILGSFYAALGSVTWLERQLAEIFLGSLPAGGFPEAEQAFKHAITLAPDVIRHRFELGDLYARQDRNREALEQFRMVMSLPVGVANDRRTKRFAEKLINELSDE